MKTLNGKPVLDRIIIKQDEAAEKTGILETPSNTKEKPKKGTVIAVGPGAINFENGIQIPMVSKVGDVVIYGEYAGGEVEIDGEIYIILKESDLYFIFN